MKFYQQMTKTSNSHNQIQTLSTNHQQNTHEFIKTSQTIIEHHQTIFNKEDWSSAYCNVEKELDHVQLKLVKGSIPEQISGTFYRNGPGRLERGGRWVHHPFDGDGMIAAFKFENGKINLTNRFVRLSPP